MNGRNWPDIELSAACMLASSSSADAVSFAWPMPFLLNPCSASEVALFVMVSRAIGCSSDSTVLDSVEMTSLTRDDRGLGRKMAAKASSLIVLGKLCVTEIGR